MRINLLIYFLIPCKFCIINDQQKSEIYSRLFNIYCLGIPNLNLKDSDQKQAIKDKKRISLIPNQIKKNCTLDIKLICEANESLNQTDDRDINDVLQDFIDSIDSPDSLNSEMALWFLNMHTQEDIEEKQQESEQNINDSTAESQKSTIMENNNSKTEFTDRSKEESDNLNLDSDIKCQKNYIPNNKEAHSTESATMKEVQKSLETLSLEKKNLEPFQEKEDLFNPHGINYNDEWPQLQSKPLNQKYMELHFKPKNVVEHKQSTRIYTVITSKTPIIQNEENWKLPKESDSTDSFKKSLNKYEIVEKQEIPEVKERKKLNIKRRRSKKRQEEKMSKIIGSEEISKE